MRKMEVLRLRVTDGSREQILDQLRMDRETMQRHHGVERVELYFSDMLESDIAVHLHWQTGVLKEEKSKLAAEISGGFRDCCIVHHTIWIHGGNYEQ